MNKNKLKQHLLKTVKDLKEQKNSDFCANGAYELIHNCSIHSSLLEINSFVKGLQLFLEEEFLNKTLAKKTIVMRYLKVLKELLDSESPSRLAIELLEGLEQEACIKQVFKVYVPLKGVKLSCNQRFHINSNCQIIYLDVTLASKLLPDKEINEFMPISIEHTIQTSDFLKAMEIAVESSKMIVHFLRFVDYQGWDEELLGLRLPGYGATMEELRVIAVPSKKSTFSSYNWRLKEAQDEELEIDDYFIEDAIEAGLEKFGDILNKYMINSLNDMETQILRAIVWFGESKIEHDTAARFLKLALVLECLLNLNKSEPVAISLSERVAFILESSLDGRLEIAKKVKHLYDVRSQIVHNGSSEVEEAALEELEYIVSQLITLFLTDEQYSLLNNKNELRNKIDNIKYSGDSARNV